MDDAPPELAALQQAFARSITTPLRIVGEHGEYELDVEAYDEEAVAAVTRGADGLGVYNEQYWFRLLTVLQEEFPLTVALAGIHAFNDLAAAYFHAHPPASPRMRDVSDRFVPFLRDRSVQPEVLDAATLDFAYIESFDAAQLPPLDLSNPKGLATNPLRFQPHVKFVSLNFNLPELRSRVRAGESVTMDDVQPHSATYAVWRRNSALHTTPLTTAQASLLQLLHDGTPLIAACNVVESTLDPLEIEGLLMNVQMWFARWLQNGWFANQDD